MDSKELHNICYTEYQKLMPELEQNRKKGLTFILISMISFITVTAAVIVLFVYLFKNFPQKSTLIGFAGLVVLLVYRVSWAIFNPTVIYRLTSSKLKHIYFSKLIPALHKINFDIKYAEKEAVFLRETLIQSGLFSQFETCDTDDSFCGTYNGVDFRICELDLGENRESIDPDFKGIVVSFKSNKKIKSNVIVVSKQDKNVKNKESNSFLQVLFAITIILGISMVILPTDSMTFLEVSVTFAFMLIFFLIPATLTSWYSNHKRAKEQGGEIKLEDVDFEKRFEVTSGDEIESRYLVTPAFMERFLSLTTAFGTKNAKCAFFKNQVMFAISTKKNLFEISSVFKPLTPNSPDNFYKELTSILQMIDYFKLDEQTKI